MKNMNMPVSEVERLPYWQYEMMVTALEKLIKDENERNKDENDTIHANTPMHQYSRMMSQMGKSISSTGTSFRPHVPKMPKI